MSLRGRDRRDLREIADALFSGDPAKGDGDLDPGQSEGCVTALWRCGSHGEEAHLATALAAASRPEGVCSSFQIGPSDPLGPPNLTDHDEGPSGTRERIERLEQTGSKLLVVLSGTDNCLSRVVALSASRHLVLLSDSAGASQRVVSILNTLDHASMTAPIGVLLPDSSGDQAHHALAMALDQPMSERLRWLGSWRPGLALPRPLIRFLETPLPSVGRLSWAFGLLE